MVSSAQNRQGQLGHADPTPGQPSLVTELSGKAIVRVACGRQHTVALDSNGRVFVWGDGTLGAAGTGKKELVKTPVQV